MAENLLRSRTVRLTAVSGPIIGAVAGVAVIIVGGGLLVGLSPTLIAALVAAVVQIAVAGLWWRMTRRRTDDTPGTAAIMGHFAQQRLRATDYALLERYRSTEPSSPPVTARSLRGTTGLPSTLRVDRVAGSHLRPDDGIKPICLASPE